NEGHDLYWWHPLVSGDPETVHAAGISARGRTINENEIDIDDLEDYVVDWPLTVGEEKDDEEA
ncbi:YcgN family cysteine cluster protein, partial [Rhizobium ruizarguesonis]